MPSSRSARRVSGRADAEARELQSTHTHKEPTTLRRPHANLVQVCQVIIEGTFSSIPAAQRRAGRVGLPTMLVFAWPDPDDHVYTPRRAPIHIKTRQSTHARGKRDTKKETWKRSKDRGSWTHMTHRHEHSRTDTHTSERKHARHTHTRTKIPRMVREETAKDLDLDAAATRKSRVDKEYKEEGIFGQPTWHQDQRASRKLPHCHLAACWLISSFTIRAQQQCEMTAWAIGRLRLTCRGLWPSSSSSAEVAPPPPPPPPPPPETWLPGAGHRRSWTRLLQLGPGAHLTLGIAHLNFRLGGIANARLARIFVRAPCKYSKQRAQRERADGEMHLSLPAM